MELPVFQVGAIHELKTCPPFFQDVLDGVKPFEIREDDRHYQVGDVLYLREFIYEEKKISPSGFYEGPHPRGRYTGRKIHRLVVYKLDAQQFVGIKKCYCVLGLGMLPHHVKLEVNPRVTRPA